MSKLNPRTTQPEFGGPLGALGITIGLPLLCNILYFGCNKDGCPASWSSFDFYKTKIQSASFFSCNSFLVYLTWFFGLVILDYIIPGTVTRGTVLRDGSRLKYKFNGTYVMIILGSIITARGYYTSWTLPEFVYIYNHFLELLNASLLWSIVLSFYVYFMSFLHSKEPILSINGNSGNAFYDWFIGRELNPRIGDFDIKTFCEMRPGLILWVLINLVMAHHQWLEYGQITDSMILVVIFQGFYVIEGTFYETGILTMMDITTDGFGFMLSFGDLTLVPFTYTMQSRYLADFPIHLGLWKTIGIVGIFLSGLFIFRLSNNQKIAFRNGSSSAKNLKYIQNKAGNKLIVSGWWGMARHINYLGDWLIAWAYSLPTLFGTPMTYYFVFFFAGLLIHREMRDEEKCAQKYKELWIEYKKRVRYRIIPYVY